MGEVLFWRQAKDYRRLALALNVALLVIFFSYFVAYIVIAVQSSNDPPTTISVRGRRLCADADGRCSHAHTRVQITTEKEQLFPKFILCPLDDKIPPTLSNLDVTYFSSEQCWYINYGALGRSLAG